MSNKSNQSNVRSYFPKLGFVLGMGSALLPAMFFKIYTPMMNVWEQVIGFGLMILGGILGFFLSARRPLLGLVLVPVALFGVSLLSWYTFFSIREMKVAALRSQLRTYTEIGFERLQDNENSDPQVRRKIVAVDEEKKDIDPVHLLLPDDLRAEKPEDVGTVIQLRWGQEIVGRYPAGGQAIRRFCDARIIEYSNKPRLLYEKRFLGSDPPNRGSSSNLYGQLPYSEIIDFVKTHSNR